jgi:WD40 repeat protein
LEQLRRPQAVPDLGRETSAFFHNFGTDLTRKSNLHLIAPNIIVYALGNSVVFEDITNGTRQHLLGLDEGGVGCVAVHPGRKMFAVGGKGFQPNIYIYSYPELEIKHVLRGGAERGYSSLSYNAHGTKLASVASSPDFMLTVWDWKQELIELHSKAFGQEVFGVKFSKDNDARLTTCGTGHIRFWKMASTFTGLKLQGDIGKFGKVELTDILAMEELPDGKRVSGSEVGALLLWEGNFIKCRFVQVGGAPCHVGNVTYVELDRTEKCLITAAEDGYIRWWDFNAIDTAEVDTDVSMDFALLPLAEYYIGAGSKIRSMLDCGADGLIRSFVINDSIGRTLVVNFPLMEPLEAFPVGEDRTSMISSGRFKGSLSRSVLAFSESKSKGDENPGKPKITVISEYHSGKITGLDVDPESHLAVTCGTDGMVRVWDYTNKKLLASRLFDAAASSLVWVPPSLNHEMEPKAKHVLVGFANGIVRCLVIASDDSAGEGEGVTIRQKFVFKPHVASVCDIKFCEDASYLCTSCRDGTIFILKTASKVPLTSGKDPWIPVRLMVVAPGGAQKTPICAETICWKSDGNAILLSCTDGVLREVNVSSVPVLDFDIESYEHQFPVKEFSGQVIKDQDAKKPSESKATEGGDGGEGGAASPSKPETAEVDVPVEYCSVKVATAVYKRGSSGIYTGVHSSAFRMHLLEYDDVLGSSNIITGETYPAQRPKGELAIGLYTSDGKAQLKTPLPTALHYTASKNYIGVGTADGSVVVRPAKFPAVFLRVSAHNGPVSFVRLSHDDKFVLSAGADGVLAVHAVDVQMVETRAENLWKDIDAGVYGTEIVRLDVKTKDTADVAPGTVAELSPRAKEAPELVKAPEDAQDIEEGAYSIQDAKLKNEQDRMMAIAEQVKDKQRSLVRALQKEYEQVLEANQSLPESVRLSVEEMTIDGEEFSILQEVGSGMLEEVHKECKRDAERAALLHDKVHSNLMDGLIIQEITLSAFSSGKGRNSTSVVRSLRTQGLPPAMTVLLESAAKIIRESVVAENTRHMYHDAPTNVRAVNMQNILEDPALSKSVSSKQTGEHEDHHAVNANARREARRIRKENLASHKKEEPKDDEDDERDLQAIDLAQRTIGDYKLKVAPDYEVPANQHVDAVKKKLQLAMLEESMTKMRLSFNERFLSLRDLKKELVFDIRRSNARIRDIDRELDQEYLSEKLWEPALDPAEYPEDAAVVTASELKHFASLRAKTKGQKDGWLKTPAVSHAFVDINKPRIVPKNYATGEYVAECKAHPTTDYTDLSVPLADLEAMSKVPDEPISASSARQKLSDAPLKSYVVDADDSVVSKSKYIESIVPTLKCIQKAKREITRSAETQVLARRERRRFLNVEREWLVKTIATNVAAFREAVDALRVDRHIIVADMKLAELKLLALFQEYSILQGFESKDAQLVDKQSRSKKELVSLELEVSDQQAVLETKEGEKKLLAEESQRIVSEFESMLPTSHAYYDQLRKIYKRKIKRGQAADEGEEEEEEEEEEEDGEDEDDEEQEDSCPPGCDPAIYERVLEHRDRKLDNEETGAALQKQIDETRRAYERLKSRLKQVSKDVKQSATEIQAFQLQKQASLNQIDVAVPLSLTQIFMFEASGALTGPDRQAPAASVALDGDQTQEPAPAPAEDGDDDQVDLSLLNDPSKRKLVAKAGSKDFCLIQRDALASLSARIGDLRIETEDARSQYGELKKERVALSRLRDAQQEKISSWKAKVRDLQMLKFGREMDLDDLEAGSNRSLEDEAERGLKEQEDAMQAIVWKLTKEGEALREKLAKVMLSNTELLREVGELTESKLSITRDLNNPNNNVSTESKDEGRSEREERQKVIAYVQLQAREIEALRAELIMLKRKEAPQMSQIIGGATAPPGAPQASKSAQGGTYEGQLPPIPGAQVSRSNIR